MKPRWRIVHQSSPGASVTSRPLSWEQLLKLVKDLIARGVPFVILPVRPNGEPDEPEIGDDDVTPKQQVYLYAFLEMVRAKSEEERLAARKIMDHAARDAGFPLSHLHGERDHDFIEGLKAYARQAMSSKTIREDAA